MAILIEDSAVHWRRNVVGAVVTVAVLSVVCVFAWRVYHFAALIQTGEINDTDLSFLSKFTPSRAAAASAQTASDDGFDVDSSDDPSLGEKDAVLTIVEFADFGCPFSREESFILRSVAARFGDRVRFVYRDFPIAELHPEAFAASEAGECAAEQGMFWEYHDKLYVNQSDLSDAALARYAAELNLNVGEFNRCMTSDRNVKEVQADYDAGVAAGVAGTPTFFLNGVRIPGAIPEDTLIQLIERFTVSS